MTKAFFVLFLVSLFSINVFAETIRLSTSNSDYQLTNTFGDVDLFTIEVDIDMPVSPGLYSDPTILNVTYRVFGSLEPGTPSGFPQFDLQRSMTGTEFYQQGSSLMFEIASNADFSDGIQANELVDNGTILTFNAREIGNGRFHPALLELYSDGSGRIQNSNNVHTVEPLLEVNFGDEYITELEFELSTTTLLSVLDDEELAESGRNSGAGLINWPLLFLVVLANYLRTRKIEHICARF